MFGNPVFEDDREWHGGASAAGGVNHAKNEAAFPGAAVAVRQVVGEVNAVDDGKELHRGFGKIKASISQFGPTVNKRLHSCSTIEVGEAVDRLIVQPVLKPQQSEIGRVDARKWFVGHLLNKMAEGPFPHGGAHSGAGVECSVWILNDSFVRDQERPLLVNCVPPNLDEFDDAAPRSPARAAT